MQKLAVVFRTLALREEMAKGHPGQIVLMQIFAVVSFFALTAQPVLAHICAARA